MVTDMTAPATKQDLANMKKEILDGVRKFNEQSKKEFLDGVQFLNENLVHNFQGALSDKISLLNDKVYLHDKEIGRIKHHLSLL